MKENTKTLVSIIAVALIIVLVGGGTYAYFTWASANNTSVTFTVTGGTMTIDGGGSIASTADHILAPAACTNTKYAIQRKVKVTAVNETTTPMTETIQLKVEDLSTTAGTLNQTNKNSLKWALVRATETQYNASTWLGCGTTIASGTFKDVSKGNTITLYSSDVAAVSTTTTYWYELYIWIDSAYSGSATSGTTVTDPLQALNLHLAWQGTMTNQQ